MDRKLAGLRILIAEDEWLLADVLVNMVEAHGGTVVGPVAREAEAVDILEQQDVDVAVLDVNLASGPCYVLADTLTQKDIPVVLMSGYDISKIPEEFSAFPTFSKPFHMESLAARIGQLCEYDSPQKRR